MPGQIGIAEVLAALVAILFLAYLLSELRKLLRRIWEWFKSSACRVRKKIKRFWNKFLLHLAPYIGWAPKAAIQAVIIAAVSALAPFLFGIFEKVLSDQLHTTSCFWRDAMANVLVAVTAGLLVALILFFTRERRIKFADDMLMRLSEAVQPDGGLDADIVPFTPWDPSWLADGRRNPYFNIDRGLEGSKEWMIVVQQISLGKGGAHTIGCLVEQIDRLEERQGEIREKRKEGAKSGEEPKMPPEVKWVCFTSKTGRFHAVQDYAIFRYQIKIKRNAAYIDFLNQIHEAQFRGIIDTNIKRSEPQTGEEPPQIYPDAIPGLETFWIEKGITNEQALKCLTAEKKKAAMLIRSKKTGEPLGMISVKRLAEHVLFECLSKRTLNNADDVTGMSGNEPPGSGPRITPPGAWRRGPRCA